MIPRLSPIMAAWVRSLAPSLERIFRTWPFTVSSLVESCAAITLWSQWATFAPRSPVCTGPATSPTRSSSRWRTRHEPGPRNHKKPAFYAGLVEVLGRFRMLSDHLNGGAGGNRTPVHKSYATRSTYVATSIVLTAHYPTGRESAQPAR